LASSTSLESLFGLFAILLQELHGDTAAIQINNQLPTIIQIAGLAEFSVHVPRILIDARPTQAAGIAGL
jgi:hypothetical protein